MQRQRLPRNNSSPAKACPQKLGPAGHATETNQLDDVRSFYYGANGNRTNNNYTTGTDNQLTADGSHAYLYDDEGNREFRFVDTDSSGTINSGDSDITKYVWDHRSRMTQVLHYATQTTYASGTADKIFGYSYDHRNRWIGKTRDTDADGTVDESSAFVYDNNQITLQFDTTGADDMVAADLSHRYLWGTRVDQLLADEQVASPGTAGTVLWPLSDNLGSVRDVIDSTGTVRIHRIYDAFGNMTETPGATVSFLFGFTSKPFDVDTGFTNHIARWYDARVGRWPSEDWIVFAAGDANLYRYVFNHPTNSLDPTGTISVKRAIHKGPGSVLPTARIRNKIAALYTFGKWTAADPSALFQTVKVKGELDVEHECGTVNLRWDEAYLEVWVRGRLWFDGRGGIKTYSFIDNHIASPARPATYIQSRLGFTFAQDGPTALTLKSGTKKWKVKSWSFHMEVTFDMRNGFNPNWAPTLTDNDRFIASGQHTFNTSLFSTVGDHTTIVFGRGFGRMLFPTRSNDPTLPLTGWKLGQFRAVSKDVWSIKWTDGQPKPSMTYQGGYRLMPNTGSP